MAESLYRPTQHRYATPTGELEPTDVRARAVGNAVYVEHVGGCGDIFAWGARDKDAADAIAGELNAVLNGLRSALADSAGKAGHYAHEMRGRLEMSQGEVRNLQQACGEHMARYVLLVEEHDRAVRRVRELERALRYAAGCSTLEMVRDAARGAGVIE